MHHSLLVHSTQPEWEGAGPARVGTKPASATLADGKVTAAGAEAPGSEASSGGGSNSSGGGGGGGAALWPLTPLRQSITHQLVATFLPAGYPASVAPGYLRFVGWQAAHHFAGSVNGGGRVPGKRC